MPVENTITTAEIARVRTVDFVYQFSKSLKSLMDALGVTRRIAFRKAPPSRH